MDKAALKMLAVLVALVGILVPIVVLSRGRPEVRIGDRGDDMRLAAATTPSPEAWLGLTLQPVTDMMRNRLGLPGTGVMVSDVLPGSPAETAGVRPGDLLQKLQESKIAKPSDAVAFCKQLAPDQGVTAMLWRRGQPLTVELRVAPRPNVPPPPPATLPGAEIELEAAWLGLDIVPLTPKEAREQHLDENTQGMLVDDVATGRAVDAGMTTGDIIVAVNGKPTRTIAELKAATKEAVGALVDVLRGGRHIYVSIAPPGTSLAERKAMQRRLGLMKVNWDGWPGWTPAWPPGRGGPQAPPWAYGGYAVPNAVPAAVVAPGWGAMREDWRFGPREDWRFGPREDWRFVPTPRGAYGTPSIGAFAVGR